MSGQKRKPSAPARTAAWAFALLLTIALTGTLISHSCVRILMSEDLHVSSATDDKVVADQMERLSDAIRELSAEYYFDAGQVIAALDREEVIRADRETAVWWTRITAEGIMDDEIPAWSADSLLPVIEESLTAEKIPEGQDSAETAQEIAYSLEKAARRTMMPVRKALITLGMRYLNKKTDLPGIIRMISAIPKTGAAACLLLAGIIALLTAGRIRTSLKYYGAAAGGAALSALFSMMLIKFQGIPDMIRESSEGLADQAVIMGQSSETEIMIAAAALLLISAACLILYNRKERKPEPHGESHEKKTSDLPDPV